MSHRYEEMKKYEGKIVRFINNEVKWVISRVVNVDKDRIELEEFNKPTNEGEQGYGFFGPFYRPFARPYPARPFVGYPFGGFTALTLLPFFFW